MGNSDPRDEEIERLRRENDQLKRRVGELEGRIADLEKKIEEALRGQKRQTAPFSKGPPKENPKPRGRKAGEDYGTHARRQAPREMDEVMAVPLPQRCECGGEIEFEQTVQQFQEEIRREPIRRRFDVDWGRCTRCGKPIRPRDPLQTSDAIGAAAPQLGPNAQAMTALLKDKFGVSYGDVSGIMRDFFGIGLSRGGAAQIVMRVAERVDAAYQGIRVVVRRSRILYPDETGWKVGGLLQWLWDFVTRTATLYVIRDSRGHDVPEEVLGLDWSGTMIHDGWAPYDFFEQADHQQCLRHPQSRCKRLLEIATRGAVRFPRAVLGWIGAMFGVRHRRDAGDLSEHGLAVAIGRMKARLDRLVEWNLTNPANLKLAKHLAAHRDDWFVFLDRPGIQPTNAPAERGLRPAIVNRKLFGGNRDPQGAWALERLASVFTTGAQRGIAIFEYLARVLCAPPAERGRVACELLGLPLPAR